MKLSKRNLDRLIIGYLILVVFVLTASIHPLVRLNKIKLLNIRLDYISHFLLFIPWMILARWRWSRGEKDWVLFYLASGAGLFLAASSELIQHFVPDRSFSVIDFAADSLGIFMGAMLAGWGRRKKVDSSKREEVVSSQ